MESPIDWVKSQKFEYRMQGDQLVLKECPICKSTDDLFFMNAKTGLWDCKHLNKHGALGEKSAGNLHTLRKFLGLTHDVTSATQDVKFHPLDSGHHNIIANSHLRLLGQPHMLAILTSEWGIDEVCVRKHKLGIKKTDDGSWWLLIPHFVNTGGGDELYNIKWRSWFGDAKTFRRVTDAASVLYNESILHGKTPKTVVLCEGEKDAIVADFCGVDNVLGMTGGAGTLLPRWYDLLEGVEDIVIAYDGDLAGSDGVTKLIHRFGIHRCRVAALPAGKDIADIFLAQGTVAVRDLIRNAKRPEVPSVSSTADVLWEDVATDTPPLIETFSKNLNRILNGGFGGAQLITLTAPPKIGKTTLGLAMAYDFAVRKIPSLVYCIEMPMVKLASMVAGMHYGTGRNVGKLEKYLFREDTDIPLYLGYQSSIEVDVLVQTFKDAYVRYGLGFIVFDNIHYMVRNISGSGGKVEAMENAYKALKVLSMDLNIPLVVIAQPRKLNDKNGSSMTYNDIAWTGSAASDSDTILVLHRERSEDSDRSFSDKLMVKTDAGRFTQGGRTFLQYRESALAFQDLSRKEIMLLGND